jgi:hypothetical protein
MYHYRQMTNKEKLRANALRREGRTYADIADVLSDESEDGRKFDRATIYRVCKNMPESPLDDPFRWYQIKEHGIPWEASGFIMQMLDGAYHARQWTIENRETLGQGALEFTPTFREVIWWWRVHEATPEIAQQVGRLADIRSLGDLFVTREIAHELLALPLETADLEACLALKPWLNEERHSNYHKMVELGVVPPVNVEILDVRKPIMGNLIRELVREKRPPELAGWLIRSSVISREHPELLASQQTDLELAAYIGALYSIDTGITDECGVPIHFTEEE